MAADGDADIPIIFSTNASEVSSQVDRATASTHHAEQASGKLESRSKTLGETLHKLGRAAGEGGHEIGKALGMGGAVGGALAGLIALHKAIEIGNFLLERNKELAKAAAEGQLEFAKSLRAAGQASASAGAEAAKSQGGNLLELIGKGGNGLEVSNKLTGQGFSANEAQGATLEAQKRFGGRYEEALQIAARASSAGGGGLLENVQHLDRGELSNPELASARLLAAHRGDANFSIGELVATESNIETSRLGQGLVQNAIAGGQLDLAKQGLIPSGAAVARGELGALKDPSSKILLDQFNVQSEQLEVLQRIADSQGALASLFDRILHPETSAAATLDNANKRSRVVLGAMQ